MCRSPGTRHARDTELKNTLTGAPGRLQAPRAQDWHYLSGGSRHGRSNRYRIPGHHNRSASGGGSSKARAGPRDPAGRGCCDHPQRERPYQDRHEPSPGRQGSHLGVVLGVPLRAPLFIPFFGMAIGAGVGALLGSVSKAGVDEAFENQVREMLKPGTSALFMVVEQMTTDKATEALSKYGGTVLKTSLSKEAEKQLQDALHGEQPK